MPLFRASFAAREVMVGALATTFAVEEADEEAMESALGSRLVGTWSLATALALLAWYVFSPQCISTFAVVRRETQSWKWTGIVFGYMLALAWTAAFVVYNLAVWAGLGGVA